MDIAKGNWEISDRIFCEGEIWVDNNYRIATVYGSTPKLRAANTRLIAEAGNIANQTGLMPKELLKQRDELFVARDELTGICVDYNLREINLLKQRDELLAACKKARSQLLYMVRNVEDDKQTPYEVLVPLKQAIDNVKGSK